MTPTKPPLTDEEAAKARAEWAAHWPFKRASPELIRRVQAAQKLPVGEPSPF